MCTCLQRIDFTEENKRVPYAVYTIKSESILPVPSYREFSGKKLHHYGFDHLYSSGLLAAQEHVADQRLDIRTSAVEADPGAAPGYSRRKGRAIRGNNKAKLIIQDLTPLFARNASNAKAHWQFTTEDARVKLSRLYPTLST